MDAVQIIKGGQDEDFFNLSTPKEVSAAMKQNKANFADKWGDAFFQSQSKIFGPEYLWACCRISVT